MFPLRHQFHPQSQGKAAGISRGEIGHGPQGRSLGTGFLGASNRAQALPGGDGLPGDHLDVEQAAVPARQHLPVVGDLRFGDANLPLEVVDLVAAIERLGLDRELHLLVVGQDLLALDLHRIEVHAGVGEALLNGDHLAGERCHHFPASQPVEVAELRAVGGLE